VIPDSLPAWLSLAIIAGGGVFWTWVVCMAGVGLSRAVGALWPRHSPAPVPGGDRPGETPAAGVGAGEITAELPLPGPGETTLTIPMPEERRV
jgi:hypothetical protein